MNMPPLVEKTYEFNKWLVQKVGKFPRDQRYLLGDRLVSKALDIQDLLIVAASTPQGKEKECALSGASQKLDQMRYLLRLAVENHAMNRRAWHFCAERMMEIGKMLGGWIKSNAS